MSLMSCLWSNIPVISTMEFEEQMTASKNKNIIGHVTLDMKEFVADAKLYSRVARDIILEGTGHHFISTHDVQNTPKEHVKNIRYYCSQDEAHEKMSTKKKNVANRERPKMKRFDW